MKITVLLDHDPSGGGNALTLQLMEALTEAGHEVDCLISDDEMQEDVVKGGVRYHHITFSGAYPALDDSEPNLVLSGWESGPHALRMASYLDVPCALIICDASPESALMVDSNPAMLIYASEFLRQTLPGSDIPSVVVRAGDDAEEVADEVVAKELQTFVCEVQDLLDDETF